LRHATESDKHGCMGYLLYADALGMQALLARDPKRAALALQQISEIARFCADQYMPGTSIPIRRASSGRLVVFNDSIFYYSPTLPEVVQFASQLAYNLFALPPNRGGSIAVRGAIIRTEQAPSIAHDGDDSFFSASRLVVDEIGGALVADKRRVLGGRIIVPREILEDQYATWDYRLQAKVIHLAGLPDLLGSDILRLDSALERYCDIAWMNIETSDRFVSLRTTLDDFSFQAVFDQRAALHAAATMAMYRATESRRRQIVVILRKLWAGVAKLYSTRKPAPPKDDYSGWMAMAPKIGELRGGSLSFPLDVGRLKLER
jgi:hypothetical protein